MTTITLTSELEAVNTLLAAIGEDPVSSLLVTDVADVADAKAKLDEVSREVQTKGWAFNTEEQYPLSRDVNGYINVPPNLMKMSLSRVDYPDVDVALRGTRLYDKVNHTYIFTADLNATTVFLLSWDELPQVARHYIMVKASRAYQARNLGATSLFQFTEADEATALVNLQEAEGETGRYNMLTDSYSVANTLIR